MKILSTPIGDIDRVKLKGVDYPDIPSYAVDILAGKEDEDGNFVLLKLRTKVYKNYNSVNTPNARLQKHIDAGKENEYTEFMDMLSANGNSLEKAVSEEILISVLGE